MNCSLCERELDSKNLGKRLKQSKSKLLFCSRGHKTEALRLGIGGDGRDGVI
jgi:hypothetical protein